MLLLLGDILGDELILKVKVQLNVNPLRNGSIVWLLDICPAGYKEEGLLYYL